MKLLENLEAGELPESISLLKIATTFKEHLQAAQETLPPEARSHPEDYALRLICKVREVATKIDTSDDPSDPESFDWQELEHLEGSPFPLPPAEVATYERYLSGLKQNPCLFSGLLLGPLGRVFREFAIIMLGLHFALSRRSVPELLALLPSIGFVA